MKVYESKNIRNITLAGHQGSGKTTLVEALLYNAGVTSRMGRTEDGNTASDFDEEEHARQMSINTSLISIEWNDLKLNILDTPGFTDFQGEVQHAIRVTDAVMVLVDAVAGPEVGTEMAFQFADAFLQPIMVVISKMDRENASFSRTLEALRERFPDRKFVPVMLPLGEQADFRGVINVLTRKAYLGVGDTPIDAPADMADEIEAAHVYLAEAAAESSDEMIEKYFDEGDLSVDETRQGMRRAARSAELRTVPVFVISAAQNIGTFPIMEAMSVYVSRPDKRRAGWRVNPEDAIEYLQPPQSSDKPLAGYVFKEYTDKFGTLSFFRIFSGKIKSNDTVYIPNRGQEERFGQLLTVRGKEQFPVEELHAGDIGVVAKLKTTHVGDTITVKGNEKKFLMPSFSEPVYAVSVHPRTQADSAKLGPTLAALVSGDPTLHWRQDSATKETILEGMGGIQIDIAIKKAERLGCHMDTSIPKIPYQETITKTASAEYTHKKQSGGAGQYARVNLRVESTDPSEPFTFASEVFGGAVSAQFIGSTEKGVRQALEQGVIAGYPVVGVKAVIYDGKMHDVDSKDIAFQTAGREAFKIAFRDASPALLEPVMQLTITVPEENMGDVMSDISTRRGSVQGMDSQTGRSIVTALVPLSEVQRYSNDLRSMTSGRGVFTMTFSHYDRLPHHLAEAIVASYKGVEE